MQQQTGLTTINTHLSHRCLSLSSHVATLHADSGQHTVLRLIADLYSDGKKPDESWRRFRGRHRRTWLLPRLWSHVCCLNFNEVSVEQHKRCGCQRWPEATIGGATVNYGALMMMTMLVVVVDLTHEDRSQITTQSPRSTSRTEHTILPHSFKAGCRL